MSHLMSRADTRTRVRPHHLVPDVHSWVDIGFTVVLSCLALSGLASSFTGWGFMLVGATSVVLAVLVTHLARALGWPVISAVVVLVALFFLLGGVLCLRSLGDSAVIPGGQTFGELVDQAVFGWKDLLTTLPPVDGAGPLLVLPWLGGLVAGTLGLGLAHLPVRRTWLAALLPVLGLTLVLVGVILVGVRHPQSLVLQGALFAGLALAWLALRARRAGATVHGGTSGWGRLLVGTVMVAVAAAVAVPASALVTGDDGRVVVRNWVEPPFDIGRYPSPLAGFRKYIDPQGVPRPGNVHDEHLFTIEGVEPGTRVRLATLDHYDGMVWGATDDALPEEGGDDSFQRVSSTIDNPVEGDEVRARVTIGEGYSDVWLPAVGALRSLEFESGDPFGKAEVFRYNLATSTGVVPTGLRLNDTYEFTAVQPDDTLDASTVLAGQAVAPSPATTFLQGPVAKWTEGADDEVARVLAAAKHLRTEGKYSDGIGRAERRFVAGHNIWRLKDEFVNAPQMVGNAEQYAAVMALAAHTVGVPARVVMGAEVPEGGVVMGKDVTAWVEVRAADGSWRTLATTEFMSDNPPNEQQPETNTPMSGTNIPPPNPIPPPSDTGELSEADLKERKARKETAEEEEDEESGVVGGLPTWVRPVAVYLGGPLLAVLVLLGAVVGLKLLRRRRRLGAASTSARFVGAWRELVDHARDLGQPVPLGATVTRREQSHGIGSEQAPALARRADSHVFGPAVPEPGAAASYWELVDAERRAMSSAVGRRRRFLAAVSLASLRRARR